MNTKLLLSAAFLLTSITGFAQEPKPDRQPAQKPPEKPAEKPASGPAAGPVSKGGVASPVAATVADDRTVIVNEKPSYPLLTCPISGEKLGADAVDKVAGGHLVRTCCSKCAAEIAKDPATYRTKVVEAVILAQKPTYPLRACPVTGEALGADAYDHVMGTRLVRLKDKATLAAFEKDPTKAMAKVDQALIEAQLATYKVTTCPVSGEELGSDAVNMLYGTRLVRTCCATCVKKVRSTPEKYLAVLDATK
jgi:hypothetical protein